MVANRLIALDKCPGVCPIGNDKAMSFATRVDVESSCGADQLYGGVRSGIEDAIHAMTSLFSKHAISSGWVY